MHLSEWHGEADGFEPGPGPPRLRQQGRRISPCVLQLFCGVCKKLGKKLSKSVDRKDGVWYYT